MKTLVKSLLLVISSTATTARAQDLPPPTSDRDYRAVDLDAARLGHSLFYDPILSGNKSIACATCHHPKFATGDGLSLSFGDGGIGLGPDRVFDPNNKPEERIPRNAPALFNLGAHEFRVMFHDGRLEEDPSFAGGIRTPLDSDMLEGFESVLAAQTMFPVLSRDEMAGSYRENDVAQAVRQGRITGKDGAWDILSKRVAEIPEYADQFIDVYDHISSPDHITFADISNAIAAFMEFEWRSDQSRFDALLRNELDFEGAELRGLELFYGTANCSNCHSGAFQTDHKFHAMGAPQIGPGKSATFETHHRDDGRFRVTGNEEDRFAFRTPSLRNVALTGPYGHAGAHADLFDFLSSHLDPSAGLMDYDISKAVLPAFDHDDAVIMSSADDVAAISSAIEVQPIQLSDTDIANLVAFLKTLTDESSITGRFGVPETVPSGLDVP